MIAHNETSEFSHEEMSPHVPTPRFLSIYTNKGIMSTYVELRVRGKRLKNLNRSKG